MVQKLRTTRPMEALCDHDVAASWVFVCRSSARDNYHDEYEKRIEKCETRSRRDFDVYALKSTQSIDNR